MVQLIARVPDDQGGNESLGHFSAVVRILLYTLQF